MYRGYDLVDADRPASIRDLCSQCLDVRQRLVDLALPAIGFGR